MTPAEWRRIRRLAELLRDAAGEVTTLGCTCVDRAYKKNPHGAGCVGVRAAAPYHRAATRAINQAIRASRLRKKIHDSDLST